MAVGVDLDAAADLLHEYILGLLFTPLHGSSRNAPMQL